MTRSRTQGTKQSKQTHYLVYYGGKLSSEKRLKMFWDEPAANKFFQEKQASGLYVEAYKQERTIIETITAL